MMNKCDSTHVVQYCVEAEGKTVRAHCIICGEPAVIFGDYEKSHDYSVDNAECKNARMKFIEQLKIESNREQLLETGLDEELVKPLTDAEVLVAAKYMSTELTSAIGGEVVKLIIEQAHSDSCEITEDYIQIILDSIYEELSDLISGTVYHRMCEK